MRRSGPATLILGMLCTVTVSLAQAPATASSGQPLSSIVTVSFNSAVLGTAEAQRDLSTLQKKLAPREQQLQKLNDDIEASKKLLSDAASKLTESEKNQRIQDLNTKDEQLQREAEDFKNDSQSESQQIFQRVAQKVYALLQEYSQQHAYSAVLERGSDTSPIVWYAASNMDITDQIIKAYNTKSGVSDSTLPDKPAAPVRRPTAPAPH
jgi:outer membrane protein